MNKVRQKGITILRQYGTHCINLVVSKMLDDDEDKLIQLALKSIDEDIFVDGIFGPATARKLLVVDEDLLLDKLYQIVFLSKVIIGDDNKKQQITKPNNKEYLMGYLASAEGTKIHFNRTEETYTTAYGIYKKSFPNSKPIKYVDKLYRKYGLDPNNRQHAKIINGKMTIDEKRELYDLAYEFYMEYFMDHRVNRILEAKGFKKSHLTLFSLNVNGGMRRGAKALQYALDKLGTPTKVDGKIGSGTLAALSHVDEADDCILNKYMIEYMRKFYARLILKNPKKFARYKRGWNNRLNKLLCS